MKKNDRDHVWCPYPGCDVEGTEDEVNDHRAEAVGPRGEHRDQPQAGSNLKERPRR